MSVETLSIVMNLIQTTHWNCKLVHEISLIYCHRILNQYLWSKGGVFIFANHQIKPEFEKSGKALVLPFQKIS